MLARNLGQLERERLVGAAVGDACRVENPVATSAVLAKDTDERAHGLPFDATNVTTRIAIAQTA